MAERQETLKLSLALLLLPAIAGAASYDPGADRAALRQAATACHATIVDATGLPLEKEKVPDIVKGLDEGLKLSRSAAGAADALAAAANARMTQMTADAGGLDRRLKEASEPVAAARKRRDGDAAELAGFKKKIDKLPEDERKKYGPRVDKADAALASADEVLAPAEKAVRELGQRSLEIKAALRLGRKSFEEASAASTATVARAGALPAPVDEVKTALASLDEPPRDASRARAQAKITKARDASMLLFQDADRACNRADDFRRASAAQDDATQAFEEAIPAATPAAALPFLDEADQKLALIRELLSK